MASLYALPTSRFPIIAMEPPHADAHLLSLDRALDAALERETEIMSYCTDEEMEAACTVSYNIEKAICAVPARTVEGLRVKAKVVDRFYGGKIDMNESASSYRFDVDIAQSIIKDLLAM